MMGKFLDMSGDINPLHIDKKYAMECGFKDRVVYGMLTSSFYSTLVGVYLPGKHCILQGINIKYSSPVYIGDNIVVSGEVSYINTAYKQLEIKAIIKNQNNINVSRATIKVGMIND
jgi:3-hydroxybutyryl-CoA dehydratase